MEWRDLNSEKPKDGERVLVCDTYFHQVSIKVYNGTYKCWDTEDGDDYDCPLDRCVWWMPLPNYIE